MRFDDGTSETAQGDGVHTLRDVHVRIDGTRPRVSVKGRTVTATDALSGAQRLQVRVGKGRWRSRSLEQRLFDGTQRSLSRWQHAGAGSFSATEEGNLRTTGGIGLLWFAGKEFGDAAFRLQWREGAPERHSNGGVFIRFPDGPATQSCDAQLPLALNDYTWHAVACGHEIQINDGDVDPQQTGSVYAFAPLDAQHAQPAPAGSWNDYEVRTVGGGDYEITVVRNGHVINRFVNSPGQRPVTTNQSQLYPGTDAKQFATGLFGLQNHGDDDVIEYRDVRVLELSPRTVTLKPRRRRVRVRAVDAAGNRSRSVTLRGDDLD